MALIVRVGMFDVCMLEVYEQTPWLSIRSVFLERRCLYMFCFLYPSASPSASPLNGFEIIIIQIWVPHRCLHLLDTTSSRLAGELDYVSTQS